MSSLIQNPKDTMSITLERLLPAVEFAIENTDDRRVFLTRLDKHFPQFYDAYFRLYSDRYDFFYHLQQVLKTLLTTYCQRGEKLKQLDVMRESNPLWFNDQKALGGVCYVDLFSGNLKGLHDKLPYFRELGLTYLHLMPLFRSPELHNDGGYAVSSFREVDPKIGTMTELASLAESLRNEGMSLVLDFVFNHTSDEHDWALRARSGERRFQDYYWMFDDRLLPDEYEKNLREIFPDQAPGSFTYCTEIQKWVWTTFYPFQWDLNYSNPEVFTAMLGEMLFLANQGVEVLRLDAVPFVWKRLGTNCENLPEVHLLIKAYNALVRIATPALIFKSEAIVHPKDVRSYVSSEKCQLSYNPILMVSLWEAAATRDVRFMSHTLQKQFPLEGDTAWVNYLRSHDDIGWGFSDEDAAEVGIKGFDHRYFLNMFYTGRFPGSFAAGAPFNYNPRTQDMRISGTLASLAGLEQALQLGDDELIDNAIRRIRMLFGIILSVGGLPLIYLGDEVGTLNDHEYTKDGRKAEDSRWIHRPPANELLYQTRHVQGEISARVYLPLRHMIEIRKVNSAFANGKTQFFDSGNWHVLTFIHNDCLLVAANFSDFAQTLQPDSIRQHWKHSLRVFDLISQAEFDLSDDIVLPPYQIFWFTTPS